MTESNADKKGSSKELVKTKISAQGRLPFWPGDLFELPNSLVRSGVFSISRNLNNFTDWTPVPAWGQTNIEVFGPQLGEAHQDVWEQLLMYKRGQEITRPLFLHTNQLLRDVQWDTSSSDGKPGGSQYAKLNKVMDELDRAKMRISDPKLLQNLVLLYEAFQRETEKSDPKLAAFIQHRYSEQIKEIVQAIEDGDEYMLTMNFIATTGNNKRKRRAVIALDPLTVIMFDGINTTLINKQVRKEMSSKLSRAVLLFVESHTGEIPHMKCSTWQGIVGSNMKNTRQFKINLRKALAECEEKGFIREGWGFYESEESGEWGTCGIYPTKKIRQEYRKAMQKAESAMNSMNTDSESSGITIDAEAQQFLNG